MSKLLQIQETVQQICSAVTSVLNIESMVLDENLQIVAGTGKYTDQIGTLEAEAFVSQEYLYKHVLRVGGTIVVDDVSDPLYGPEQYGETGEICCAIPYRTGSIGILALIAFDDQQYEALINNSDNICAFLQNMSLLISTSVSNTENYERADAQARLLNEVVESSPHGIIIADSLGRIVNLNSKARAFLQNSADPFPGILGKDLDAFWKGSSGAIIENEQEFRNKEFTFNDGQVRVVMSTRLIYNENQVEQVVIFFDDVIEAKQNAYDLLDAGRGTLDSIVGSSKALSDIKRMVPHIAASSSTVLITGESGTGKELFAKAIHYYSPRSSAPFVTINCGAIPETLIESELFGYVKGAFTGADIHGHEGRFEKANGGTIFIDEIGDLPLNMQMKLLHVLQRKKFERIGSSKTISLDVRFIAATNRDLRQMIAEGTFREDLFYRLNVIPIEIPPLRERPEDLPALVNHLIARHAGQLRKNVTSISSDAMAILMHHDWPGNIRELENAIEFSVNMAAGNMIRVGDLLPNLRESSPAPSADADKDSLRGQVENYENLLLLQQLKDVDDGLLTKSELARQLGISRSSLYRRISRLQKNDR